MKTPTLLFLSFLLLGTASVVPSPVLDTDGKALLAGTKYYILPVVRGMGGGPTLASTGRNGTRCPLDVVQEQHEVDNGLLLYPSPVNPKEGVSHLGMDHKAANICVQSTVWGLDLDESIGTRIVTSGGVVGNPGRETISHWFSIENYDDDFKLVYCPGVCNICRPACGELGIYIDENGTRRLAKSDVPFKVMFKKA